MDKHSKIKRMRRKKKLFPWLRTFYGKYSEKFFNTDNTEIFEYLFLNVDEEMKNIYLDKEKYLNEEKEEEFFNILNTFFLHFWRQIRWKSWKKVESPEVLTNNSHRKCCVQLLYYMILLSIFLTGGDEKSDWIGRILTAVKSLPDAVDILCSALLLINDLKKKHKPIYNIILKHTLCCESVENATEPQTYCKVILLFRRLLKLNKDQKEKSRIFLFTSKIRVPCDIQHWLSSKNIEDSKNLNYDNLTQELLSRSYPDELLRKLSEILVEHSFCEEKSFKINSGDASSLPSNVNLKKNISEDTIDVSEPDEDLLDSLINTNIENSFNGIEATTSCKAENASKNVIKGKDLHNEASNLIDETCEINVNYCSESLEKPLKKQKRKNEENDSCSHKKKKKDGIFKKSSKDHKKNKKHLKKHKKRSKEKLEKTVVEINEDFEIHSQLSAVPSGIKESNEFKRALDEELETSHKKSKCHKNKKKSRKKPDKSAAEINGEIESCSLINVALSDVEESHMSQEALDQEVETSQQQQNCNLEEKKKKLKSKNREKKPKHSKKSKKHSREKKSTTSKVTSDFVNPNTILMVKSFLESGNHDECMEINGSYLATSNIEELYEFEKPLEEKVETSHVQQDCNLKAEKKKLKSKNKKKHKHLKESKKHSKEKKSTKSKRATNFDNPDTSQGILPVENFSEIENLLLNADNCLDESIHASNGEKLTKKTKRDKIKKVSKEKHPINFVSGSNSSIPSLGNEIAINEPKKSPKLRMKKLFNNELNWLTKSQKEIQSGTTITNNCAALPKFSPSKKRSFLPYDSKLHNQVISLNTFNDLNNCNDIPPLNPNVYSNSSFIEETAPYSDVSLSELLKLPRGKVYHNTAALGIEDKHTSKPNSKDLKDKSTEHNVLSNKKNLCGSEQDSELSSLKNDLLMASKKILEQSYISEPCNYNQSTETLSFRSTNVKESNSDFVNRPYMSNKCKSTSVMTTKHSNEVQSTAIFQQPQVNRQEVNIQGSEYSYDSFSHSTLTPSVMLKDVLRCKLAQKYFSAPKESFTSYSESDNGTRSSTPFSAATNFEMNVSQELTLENIAKVDELYRENESALINYLCNDEKDNVLCMQNAFTVPIDDNSNHHTELSEFQSSTSPSLIQIANNNILLNEFQSEFLNNSIPQPLFHSSVVKSQTNESGTQYLNIEGENTHYKSVGTATEVINSNDFAVNCNMNDNSNQNSNTISSVQVIINFTNNNDCSTSNKQQFVANIDFKSGIDSSRIPAVSSLFLNPINSSSCMINNIHNPNPNATPNYQPLHIIPFNQATNSIEKSVNSNNTNIFCKPKKIGECFNMIDSGSTQNLLPTSSPIKLNNSCNRTESQDVDLSHLTTENLEFQNSESNELSLEADVSNNNSSYRNSTIYSDVSDDNDSVSTVTDFSDFQTELSVGETLEIGASPKSSNCKRNKFQVDSEPESLVKTDFTEPPRVVELEPFKKDNAESKKISEEDNDLSKSTSKKRKTPKNNLTPVNHRYNLRARKSLVSPKALDEYVISMAKNQI